MGTVRRRGRTERGAAAVEFALIVMPLCIILFGILDYGMMLSFRQSVSQSAAEGARAAAVTLVGNDAARTTNAETAVTQALGNGITCSGGTLTRSASAVGTCGVTIATCSNNTAKTCITVTVTYNYKQSPTGPVLPLVPMPSKLSYSGVAEEN